MTLYGGIEAGGTKFVCAIGDEAGNLQSEKVVKTTVPAETLSEVIAFFKEAHSKTPLSAIGIGSFGPIETTKSSPKYGYILQTPKKAWINCDFAGSMTRALNLPVGFDTDVNAAALGEAAFGAAQGFYNFMYMTVGTGIGAAAMIDRKLVHGLDHSEMGHMRIPHDKVVDPFAGVCLYHGDCLEGLACGTAIKARWQLKSALDLPEDHAAWDLEADYLASGLVNCITILSPERIILGGGVMRQTHLFPMIQQKIVEKINGYLSLPDTMADYIVPPQLGDHAGVIGALVIAKNALGEFA